MRMILLTHRAKCVERNQQPYYTRLSTHT